MSAGQPEAGELSRQGLEAILDRLPFALIVTDATGAVLRVNTAFTELSGFASEQAVGSTPPYPWWDTGGPARAGDGRQATGAPSLQERDAPGGRRRLCRRDGTLVPVETVVVPLGTPQQIDATLIENLSDRLRFERQLVQTGKLAALGELAPGVAHEINNPLFAILGLVELLLLDLEPGTKTYERLLKIQESGLEIKEIVRALVSFAREHPDEYGLFALEDVVATTVELVKRTTPAKDVEIVERYGEGAYLVEGSANRLKQLFLNLLSNAQQAMPNGGAVTIELRRDGDVIEATMTDTGVGIAEDVLPRIFEPFFTTKHETNATGLGLAIAQWIAHVHGGALVASAPPGGGAELRLRLPAAARPQASAL